MNTRILALAALLVAAPVLEAGTPLICHPYAIGNAKSLPGASDGPHGTSASYDRTHLVGDTLSLLTPTTPVIVRMETIRRAVIYATAGKRGSENLTPQDHALVSELLAHFEGRAGKAPADALAQFDYGFLAETLRHMGVDRGIDGYALLSHAAQLKGADANMELALALASSWPMRRPDREQHIARARTGAANDPLLAQNVALLFDGS